MTIIRVADGTAVLEQSATGELDARLIAWNTAAVVSDDGGRTSYTESWEPGSLTPAARVAVFGSHAAGPDGRVARGPLIGVARNVESRDDGLYATLALAGTPAATEVRELARLVGAYVSIEAEAATGDNGATVIRTAAAPAPLTGVAVILPPQRPAYETSEVLAVRAAIDTPTEPDPTEPDDPDGPDDPTVSRSAVAELVRTELARTSHRGAAPAAHPAARWPSMSAWAEDAYKARSAGEDPQSIARALANQITTDNPGVVPPSWVSNVYGIIARPRRTIGLFGAFPDPGYGMEIDYPLFTGDLSTFIGNQVTEKTAITSVKVSIGKGSAALKTYAGGSDISYQLIRRSSPSYREAYMRIMAAAYAMATENAVADAAMAVAVPSAATWVLGTGTADILRAALFTASLEVETATGAPAGFALAASDVFAKIGGLANLWPTTYGTTNIAGTAQASNLRINVSGLEIYHVPQLAAGSLLVSNEEAGGVVEEGMYAVTAEDVELLGQNVAVWGMLAFVAPIPAGIRKITATGTRAAKGE